jgi:hypothetical protein
MLQSILGMMAQRAVLRQVKHRDLLPLRFLGHVTLSAPEVVAGVPQTFGLIGTTVTKGDIASAALNYKL